MPVQRTLLWKYDIGTPRISVQYQSWRWKLGFLRYLKASQFGRDVPSSLSMGSLETQSNSYTMFACLGGCGQPGGEGSATDMSFTDAQKILYHPLKGSESLSSVSCVEFSQDQRITLRRRIPLPPLSFGYLHDLLIRYGRGLDPFSEGAM